MPPTKVCPQCKATVPVRWKTCERCDHVFRSKGKAEKAMKRVRAVELDSVKSARKAKDKACERASEILEQTLHRQEQNRMGMASMRESRDSLVSTQAQSHALMRQGFGTSVPFISALLVLLIPNTTANHATRKCRTLWGRS